MATRTDSRFDGRQILLVEDWLLVAEEVESMLRQLGCDVVGPAPNVQRALEVIDGSSPDAALLDIDLDGESVAPVAARLRERSIPFAFTTGYQDPDLPPEFHSAPQLRKPFRSQQLAEVIATLLKDRTAPA